MSIHNLTRTYQNTWPTTTNEGTLRLKAPASSINEGGLKVTPVLINGHSPFGAEIEGIDWSRPIPEALVNELVQLQNKYAVLIFRNTGLDNARHIAFAQQLGKDLEVNPFFFGRENDRIGEPFLWDVGNINRDGTTVQPGQRRWEHSKGNALWHTDSSFHKPRAKYSLLLSHGKPAKGGSWTHFADTRSAYAALPQSRKDELESLVVEHDLWHSRKLASPEAFEEPLPHERELVPPVCQKLVQTAPNGNKTLYLAAHAKRIIGKSFEDSQKLIWELIDHCTQPQFVFSMEWLQGGDMVWWDNRQSMHRANPYTTSMTARDVRRATVNDDGPFALGVPTPNI
ncbi:hypothetical protein PMIN04_000199 [Paraphaeosphaeria minitans]|uniref:Alpha-ketoglutarate-dependent 2 n=1 Tax=Paraphaeosphaeria minitans TaxID=565426 RepID=A0A9P6KK68_9PLEO|nr:alpha-ketoglutarate-dependent 2 [Paraphaeosphaeria minitans]